MFAVIRIRSGIGAPKVVRDTLNMLRLKTINSCVLLPDKPDVKGMLEKVKDYITYGEIEKETLIHLLKKRLRARGDKRVSEEMIKKITGYDFEALADGLLAGKNKLKDFPELKPVFRLTPPSKGFKSVKLPWPKGDLGYRGKAINELLKRMI